MACAFAAYAAAACPFLARATISVALLSGIFLAASAVDGTLALREVAGVVLTGLAVVVVSDEREQLLKLVDHEQQLRGVVGEEPQCAA